MHGRRYTHRGTLLSNKTHQRLIHATTRLNLRMNVLSEISQPKGVVARELGAGTFPRARGNFWEQWIDRFINLIVVMVSQVYKYIKIYQRECFEI